MHETQMHESSCFLTLTFNDDNLPADFSVDCRDVQLFMKRLRKYAGSGIRFFACGEYGETDRRPHYHLLVFGFDFSDKYPFKQSGSGHILYRSPKLEELWPFGFSWIGTVTSESAGYVARYILKKVGGEPAEEHYTRVHPITGQIVRVRPEFITMSRKPGIGMTWFDKYSTDAFPKDFVTIEGKRTPIPPAYTKRLEEKAAFYVKAGRKREAFKFADNNTPERLAVREEVLALKVKQLTREIDDDS